MKKSKGRSNKTRLALTLTVLLFTFSLGVFSIYLSMKNREPINTTKNAAANQSQAAIKLPWQSIKTFSNKNIFPPHQNIIQVDLEYSSENDDEKIKISKITKMVGYPTTETQSNDSSFNLFTLTKNRKLDKKTPLFVPKLLAYESAKIAKPGGTIEQKKVPFSINLPYSDSVATLEIRNKGNKVVASREITTAQVADIQPNFETITGSSAQNVLGVDSSQQSSPFDNDSDIFFDIVFLSSDYELSDFREGLFDDDVNSLIKSLVTQIEPFKSRASSLRFHKVATQKNLGCKYLEKELTHECSEERMKSIVNEQGLQADFIYTLINSSYFGGSSAIWSNTAQSNNHRRTYVKNGHLSNELAGDIEKKNYY